MRINVLRKRRRIQSEDSSDDAHHTIVNLMVAVAKILPTAHFQHLREQLEDMT
jgi:hypothetical protein